MSVTLEIVNSEPSTKPVDPPGNPDRADLADAIEARDAADSRLRIAQGIYDAALAASTAEADQVASLEAACTDARRAATEEAARRFAQALRTGGELPAADLAPEADTAALVAAQARLGALELATRSLGTERDQVAHDLASAADAVASLVDAILDAEAAALAEELIAAQELAWRLLDRLSGLAILDGHRPAPRLLALQKEVVARIDRRKAAAIRNPLMNEQWNYNTYLDGLASAAEARWLDYGRRLALDPAATFETERD